MLKVVGASWNKIRASTWIIGVVFVLGIVAVILGELGQPVEDGNWGATVYWGKESGFEIVFWGQGRKIESIPKGVARAYYQCHVNATGWAVLDIETQPDYPDWVQAFGAGMLEGSLSWQMIHWQRQNTLVRDCESNEYLCREIREYIKENLKWVRHKFMNATSPYWHQIRLFYYQLEGIHKGFEQGIKRSRVSDVDEMTLEDFVLLNSIADIRDLKYKFSDDETLRESLTPTRGSTLLRKLYRKRSISYPGDSQILPNDSKRFGFESDSVLRCGRGKLPLSSALVKLIAEQGKILIAHNSAGPYSSMLKMIKHYQFPYRMSPMDRRTVHGKRITFSSYPGVIHSTDDFFIIQNDETDEELVVTGVPIPVFDADLWDANSPVGQILIGPRMMATNRLASDGKEWSDILSRHNSGTANRQWTVVDFKKFRGIASRMGENAELYVKELKQAVGLLYVAEQIPGTFEARDETRALVSNTYWASYGLPSSEVISNISGTEAMEKKSGELYSYEKTPLAMIFRRDHGKATNVTTAGELMRSNNYKTDQLSHGNPRCAVGGRGDAGPGESEPVGVTDTKIFSNSVGRAEVDGVSVAGSDEPERGVVYSEREFQIKAGPPYSDSWNVLNRTEDSPASGSNGSGLGPFDWNKNNFSLIPHTGHPDLWNFEPLIIP